MARVNVRVPTAALDTDAAALYPGDWERRCRGCYPVFGGVVGYYEEGQGGHICQPCEEYDL